MDAQEIRINTSSVQECYKSIKHDFEQKNPYSVLIGAGISISSGLPSGAQLKAALFEQIPTTSDDIKKYWLPHVQNDKRFQLRLHRASPEVIFGALSETGSANLGSLMRAFQGFEPNSSHRMIMQLFSEGYWSCVATTNFDPLLETALKSQSFGAILPSGPSDKKAKKNVLKLHGSCDVLDSQVVALFDFWRGIWNDAIKSFVGDLEGRNLLVLGYSGYDFDILIRLIHSRVNRVYWLCQPGQQGFPFPELPQLFEANRLFRLECDIHQVIKGLGGFLKINDPEKPPNKLSTFLKSLGGFGSRSLKTSDDFLRDVTKWGETLNIAVWLEVCGTILYELFEFPGSIFLFKSAIEVLQESQVDYVKSRSRLLRKISESHIQMRRYADANKYASMSVNLLVEHEAYELVAADAVKSIRLFEKTEQYEYAEKMLKQYFPYFDQRRLLYGENIKEYTELVLAHANLFVRRGDIEAAEVALRHAREEAKALGSILLYIDASFRLVQVLMKREDIEAKKEALPIAMEIYHLGNLWGNLGIKHKIMSIIPYIYSALEDIEMAATWLAKTHHTSDTVQYPEKFGNWDDELKET